MGRFLAGAFGANASRGRRRRKLLGALPKLGPHLLEKAFRYLDWVGRCRMREFDVETLVALPYDDAKAVSLRLESLLQNAGEDGWTFVPPLPLSFFPRHSPRIVSISFMVACNLFMSLFLLSL